MNEESTIIWRRLDMPGHESVRIFFDEESWYLEGTAVFLYEDKPCRLDYLIECDDEWNTTAADITGWVGDELVELEIDIDDERRWFINRKEWPEVKGCLDIDFHFSPVTNTLPIRRLEIPVGNEAAVKAAWLKFPDFNFEPLEQAYTRLDENTYRYESGGGSFVREIKVNEAGLVTDYPDYFAAEKM
jgi:uncharacterized protein